MLESTARRIRKTFAFFSHLRYGENPSHPDAAWWRRIPESKDLLATHYFKRRAGRDLSFLNVIDISRATETIARIAAGYEENFGPAKNRFIAVILKHGNACGAAVRTVPDDPEVLPHTKIVDAKKEVLQAAIQGDSMAAFGGTLITNFTLTAEDADVLLYEDMTLGRRRVYDVVIAPHLQFEAVKSLTRPKEACIMLENEALWGLGVDSPYKGEHLREVRGGLLREKIDFTIPRIVDAPDDILYIRGDHTRIGPNKENLILAWAVGSTSTSNSITVTHDEMVLVNACGLQSRVLACDVAGMVLSRRTGRPYSGLVAYSDGFFPFKDGPQILQTNGIDVLLAPRGSYKDVEVGQAIEGQVTFLTLPPIDRGFYGH